MGLDANVCKLKTSAKYTETVNQCNLILFIGPLKGLVTKYYYFLSKFIYSFILAEFSSDSSSKYVGKLSWAGNCWLRPHLFQAKIGKFSTLKLSEMGGEYLAIAFHPSVRQKFLSALRAFIKCLHTWGRGIDGLSVAECSVVPRSCTELWTWLRWRRICNEQ